MAQSGFAAFLLFLGLMVSRVSGDDANVLCQGILNANLSQASLSGFNLTVAPTALLKNTTYTVELVGAGNFTVLLQAVNLSSPVGTWSPATNSCNGSPLFIEYSLSNKPINTTWTSPDNVASVSITAYIHNGTDTFVISKTLSTVPDSPTNITTAEPTTANNTGHWQTSNSVASSTHHVPQTTNAGSIKQSSFVPMALSVILSLLLVPNKNLS